MMVENNRGSKLVGFFKYSLVSLFVIWHCGALIVAPAPASYIVNEAYSWYKPYLSLFNLDNGWGFFAPDPPTGGLMQYTITDQDGNDHLFHFTSQLDRQSITFQRYTMTLVYLVHRMEPYTTSAGHFFCRKHKDLNPAQVQFRFYFENIITPEAYAEGARPLDENNLELDLLRPITC